MILTLEPDAEVGSVTRELGALGVWTTRLVGRERVQLLIGAGSARVDPNVLSALHGVADVSVEPSPHPLLDAQPRPLEVSRVPFGAGAPAVLMAGPCSVESEAHIHALARQLAEQGVHFLRGGAFKPRTSPYAFAGHGARALGWMRAAARAAGLRVVTELMSPEHAELVAEHADLVQIGSRSMQSFELLHAAARTGRPILLKRGMAATVDEWLMAAEHCLAHGAPGVVLCERGIRGFDPRTRNLIDLGAVALLAHAHGLPVVVDPSHALGRRDLVDPISHAAIAAGAAGLLVEVHDDPGHAASDGPQALTLDAAGRLFRAIGAAR